MRSARWGALLVAVLLPALGLNFWMWSGGTTAYRYDVSRFPRALGPWAVVEEERLTTQELSIIEPDEHLMLRYGSEPSQWVWLYVGLYSGRGGLKNNAHDPEVCYPAQGWDISSTRELGIPLGDGQVLRTRQLRARHATREEVVIYWFQPAQRWPSSPAWEEVLRIRDAVLGSPHYAFVRVSVPSTGSGVDAEQARDFARRAALPVRQLLESAQRDPT